MVLWPVGCFMILWFHGALQDLCFMAIMVLWWSLIFYSCLFLVLRRIADLFPVLMGPCTGLCDDTFGFNSARNLVCLLLHGDSPRSCIPSCYFCPWEVQLHVCLDNSWSPAQTQLHANLVLHMHQHLGWEGRKDQIIQIDRTDDPPALVLWCQGYPSHFATSAGQSKQILCPGWGRQYR